MHLDRRLHVGQLASNLVEREAKVKPAPDIASDVAAVTASTEAVYQGQHRVPWNLRVVIEHAIEIGEGAVVIARRRAVD